MSLETTESDPVKRRQDWLKRLANEYIKLESFLPGMNFLPDEGCPTWVENLEREVGATMFPVAKLKEESKLTPRRLAAIFGHQCAIAVWMMEWLAEELEKPQTVDDTKITPEQLKQGEEFLIRLTVDWYADRFGEVPGWLQPTNHREHSTPRPRHARTSQG